MEVASAPTIELIALKSLERSIRCVAADGTRFTYRRRPEGIVPGLRLTITAPRATIWRKTPQMYGELRSKTFSLRALARAGFALPCLGPHGLTSPGERDDRLIEGLADLASGGWFVARAQLLDVLETQPGCLVAHSRLGLIASALEHRGEALAHMTAAVRLGMGALQCSSARVEAEGRAGRALLEALRGRAEILLGSGDVDAALADLRRAMAWDPTDSLDLGGLLEVARATARPAAS